jgi:hypothetical protein
LVRQRKTFQKAGNPVISVDAKQRELVGRGYVNRCVKRIRR